MNAIFRENLDDENKDKELRVIRSHVKQKLKFTTATSTKRMQSLHKNLDDEDKV